MLTDLRVQNFAIIDDLDVSFGPGLNVLTGETGAGKSIIIDALSVAIGQRVSLDLIRAGADEAVIEVVFDLADQSPIKERARNKGIEVEDIMIVKRQLSRSGRSRTYINGSPAPLNVLAEIAGSQVDIYGQQEHYHLIDVDRHLDYLDAYGGLLADREEYGELFGTYAAACARVAGLKKAARQRAERGQLLEFQTKEIAAANLARGEDEQLKDEFNILSNAMRLKEAALSGETYLYSGDSAARNLLLDALKELKELENVDKRILDLNQRIQEVTYEVEDIAAELRTLGDKVEDDPLRLEQVEERLFIIGELKKKYGGSLDAILSHYDSAQAELESLSGLEDELGEAESESARLRRNVVAAAGALSQKRQKAALRLKELIEPELEKLGMKGSTFTVKFKDENAAAEPTDRGVDKVEFWLSANPGEPVKPLARVVSGGELSRIMLALKCVLADRQIPTLIFDEVDSGIGGGTSEVVGRKLKELAGTAQVLCVTHIHQIAAFAENHFSVAKGESQGRVATTLKPLNEEADRVEEIARMMGGASITDKTRAHAREVIKLAGADR
jgi:DNA repair protein RecN (Recombination protein N)